MHTKHGNSKNVEEGIRKEKKWIVGREKRRGG